MTGETHKIDPITGEEPDGTVWRLHAAIAKAVGGTVQPFDNQYQGPYVLVGTEYDKYERGVIRLWIIPVATTADVQVYREDTDSLSSPFKWDDDAKAAKAALSLMEGEATGCRE